MLQEPAGRSGLGAGLVSHQANSPDKNKNSEDVLNPLETSQQRSSNEDKNGAHDNGAKYAPEEHAPLLLDVQTEGAEHEQEDEEIVDAQREFDQVTREEFEAALF